MALFRRRPNLIKLAIQLDETEHSLRLLAESTYVPNPKEVEALAYIRRKLKILPAVAESTEKECWRRVGEYIATPWTPAQRRKRKAVAFLGWWLFGTIGIWQGILGWFVPLFPRAWMVVFVSALLSFFGVVAVIWRESKE